MLESSRPTNLVVEGEAERPALEGVPKPKRQPKAPKWEIEARDRLRAVIKRYAKPLNELVARDANEGDTRLLVTDFLCDGLGFDKYADLTTEYAVRGEFADYGIRIDQQLIAFIECKRATTKLSLRHLRQVEMYAVNEGIEWVILTNGADWQVYHLTGGLPVVIDLALTLNLLGEQSLTQKTNAMFYLTKESLRRRQIDELWRAKAATSANALGDAILSPAVLTSIRREVRRRSKQHVDEKELSDLIKSTVLRPEALGS